MDTGRRDQVSLAVLARQLDGLVETEGEGRALLDGGERGAGGNSQAVNLLAVGDLDGDGRHGLGALVGVVVVGDGQLHSS